MLVSFVNTYETIKHFSKSFGNTAQVENFQCEENASDSEESKVEKEFSDDFYLTNHFVSYYLSELNILGSKQNNHFPTSDYYQEIFFPPELS